MFFFKKKQISSLEKKMDKKIKVFARNLMKEYGYDDENSIYEKNVYNEVWTLLFEKKNIFIKMNCIKNQIQKK